MKVLHYIGTFSHIPETFIYDLILNLSNEKNQEHVVLCHNRINDEQRPYQNIHVIKRNRSLFTRLYHRFYQHHWLPIESKKTNNVINKIKPNLIHAHFGPNGLRIGKLLKFVNSKTPVIIHCHGTDVLSMPYLDKSYLKNLLEVAKLPNVYFVSNTEFLKKAIIALRVSSEKISIVRNALNTSFFSLNDKKLIGLPTSSNRSLKLIAIGRMIRWKGHRYLLEGLAQFLNKFPNAATLTLIGDGDERYHLETLCRQLNISRAVVFTGALPHHEVAKALKHHHVLIQPSIIDPKTRQCESFGMTILEAIASGLPVAVSRSGGMPELIGRETPWSRLFEPASANAIADVIAKLHVDLPNLGSNENYAKERLGFYSWENQRNALLNAYEKAIN